MDAAKIHRNFGTTKAFPNIFLSRRDAEGAETPQRIIRAEEKSSKGEKIH